jgi:ABC-type bacteriocin/lantibiotic exporters, contain an N-terminal double-glycine peptidase domain
MAETIRQLILRCLGVPLGQSFPCIRQHNEEDCGAACLATVCARHRAGMPLGWIRHLVGTSREGTTLLGLKRGAEKLGFHAQAAKADASVLNDLQSLPLPLICHWQGCHWVVLHGMRGDRFLLADPAVGLRQLTREQFLAGWANGVVLLLEPDPARFPVIDQQPQRWHTGQGLAIVPRLLQPFRALLLQALGLNLAIGVLALAMPLLMQILTDDVLIRGDGEMLRSLSIGILLLFVFRALLTLLQGVLVGHFGQKLQLQMVLHYGQHLLRLPLSYFESRRSGEVVSRLDDIQRLNALVANLTLGLPGQFCIALVSLIWMWQYSGPLTLAALAGFSAVVATQLAVLPALHRRTQQLLVQSAQNQGFLVELFSGQALLKTTQATPQAWQEFQRNQGRIARQSWGVGLLDLQTSTATGFLGQAIGISLLWYGSVFVLQQQLSIGQLLAFNGMGANVLAFLAGLSGVSQELITSRVVMARLDDALQHPLETDTAKGVQQARIPADADILCEDVSFHHPGRTALLDHLNLRIPGGLTTALIGESGCGKSTLSKLIAGLYSPESGAIHYGAYSGRDLSLESLRQQVVLLPQQDTFLNRSIFENFTFAYPHLGFAEIVELCRLTLADEFIRELPDSYGTVLGEFGANLSGGQRQRLALARALAADPPVLLLDESTSALDPVLEARLMDRLLELRQGKTTILVSHRPSVILRADWVVFMEKGAVRQQSHPRDLRDHRQVSPYLHAA